MPKRDFRTTALGDETKANLKGVKQMSMSTNKLSEEARGIISLSKYIRHETETTKNFN